MAESRVAGRGVSVTDDRGVRHSFLPGDRVPGDLVELITNPKVWTAKGQAVVEEDLEEESFEPDDNIGELTKAQLLNIAEDRDIKIPSKANKSEIIEILRGHGAL